MTLVCLNICLTAGSVVCGAGAGVFSKKCSSAPAWGHVFYFRRWRRAVLGTLACRGVLFHFLVSASAFTVLRLEPAARAQELQGMKELIEQAAGNRSLSRGKRANAALVKQDHDLVLSREAEADR